MVGSSWLAGREGALKWGGWGVTAHARAHTACFVLELCIVFLRLDMTRRSRSWSSSRIFISSVFPTSSSQSSVPP